MTDPTNNLTSVQADSVLIWNPTSTSYNDVASDIRSKADRVNTYVKAETYSQPEVDALLGALSDTTVTEQLLMKADISDVYRALALKRNVADSYTKIDVDELLAPKAFSSDVTSSLALKRSVADSYTKIETDVNVNLGVAVCYVSFQC